MDAQQVLQHLQQQFAGQMVLYVSDMATILGKSEKAVSNLIARDSLPFKVKNVGGHRCVDIFQIAQWLSSDADMGTEALAADKPSKSVKQAPAPKARASAKPVQQSSIGQRIMQLRHDNAVSLSRFAATVADPAERLFLFEVVEKFAATSTRPDGEFLLSITTVGTRDGLETRTVAQQGFDELDAAYAVLAREVRHPGAEGLQRIELLRGRACYYRAVFGDGGWVELRNKVPGLFSLG